MGAPITATVITDSIGADNPRLTTFLTRYPKFVHGEHCRHRSMSLCVSSSRAIPTKQYLQIVSSEAERAEPAIWGSAQPGMSPGDELDDTDSLAISPSLPYALTKKRAARHIWACAARVAVRYAEELIAMGVHKSIANRLLDPFVPVNVLVTCCEPGLLNFFGLRLDRAADPTIRVLAEAMWAAWNESTPKKIKYGDWHMPFVDEDPHKVVNDFKRLCEVTAASGDGNMSVNEVFLRVSTARCAHLSYRASGTSDYITIERALEIYEKLNIGNTIGLPIHASPAEHQCTPDEYLGKTKLVWRGSSKLELNDQGHPYITDSLLKDGIGKDGWIWEDNWKNEHLHGNLPGWVQHRKLIPGEAIAPLPEEYR